MVFYLRIEGKGRNVECSESVTFIFSDIQLRIGFILPNFLSLESCIQLVKENNFNLSAMEFECEGVHCSIFTLIREYGGVYLTEFLLLCSVCVKWKYVLKQTSLIWC